MQRQSGVMSIRGLRNWLGLDSDDFTLVTFESVEGKEEPRVKRLATGSWEHCRSVMENLSPKGSVAEWVDGYTLLMMQDLKNKLVGLAA